MVFVLIGLSGLVVLIAAASIAVGANPLSPGEVWHGLIDPSGDEASIIVNSLRVPRTILGLVVGSALGIAGALMQGHTRNPLADPGLLGVSDGAACGVVVAVYGLGVNDLHGYLWFGFTGALVASVAVFLIGGVGRGGHNPITLAIAGVAIGALLKGVTATLALFDSRALDAYRFWAVGSLSGRPRDMTVQILPFILLGLVATVVNLRGLNAISLGEDVAKALGHRILLTRVMGIAAITLLTGSAVAAAGPLAFVGLVVPHAARAITGPDHRWLVPVAGLLGATLLLATDVVGRMVARPGELVVGTALAFIGAPFFIALVRRRKLVRL